MFVGSLGEVKAVLYTTNASFMSNTHENMCLRISDSHARPFRIGKVMENFYGSLPIFFLFLVVFIISFKLWSRQFKKNGFCLPPGALGFPIIGESIDFFASGKKGYPFKFISHRIAKYSSDVFKTNLFVNPTVVFPGASGNKFLFSNEKKHVHVWFPKSIYKLFTYNSSSTMVRVKKLLSLFLKSNTLQRHVGVMDSVTRTHFATFWDHQKEVTVFPLTKTFSFSVALMVFMSIEDSDTIARIFKMFRQLSSATYSVPINLPGTKFSKGLKASRLIAEEIMKVMKQRRVDLSLGKTDSKQDLLSLMLSTCDVNGEFVTDMELAAYVKGLIFGGHDTVSSACASTVKYLSELPEIYDRVYNEQMEIARSKEEGELLNWEDIQKMKYSWKVVCEVLRLAPPGRGTFREAMDDFVYKGFCIPKGWKLYWSASWTHRNPDYFPEPDKFDPSRFDGSGPPPYCFVPFGGGPRMCPGKEYSRIVILVFIHNLVKRYKFEKMIPDEKVVFNPIIAVLEKGLPVKLYPHHL